MEIAVCLLGYIFMSIDKFSQRSNQFSLVLNDSGANVFQSSKHIVYTLVNQEDVCVIYCACIMHDKDEDELGNLKTNHYHLVVQLNSQCRLRTFLNFIIDKFHCNENQVSIEKCSSIEMQTRYLIHLDDFDKFQYDVNDIVSNNDEFVKKCMSYIKSISCVDDLIAICQEYKNNLLKLMSVIGYENYKKYRVVIADIRREILGLPIK